MPPDEIYHPGPSYIPPEYEVGPDYGAPEYKVGPPYVPPEPDYIYHPGPPVYQPPAVRNGAYEPQGGFIPVPSPTLPAPSLPAVSWEDRQMQIVQELTQKATQPIYEQSKAPGTPVVGITSVYRVLAGVNAGATFTIQERFPDGNVRAIGIDYFFTDILRPGEYVQVS